MCIKGVKRIFAYRCFSCDGLEELRRGINLRGVRSEKLYTLFYVCPEVFQSLCKKFGQRKEAAHAKYIVSVYSFEGTKISVSFIFQGNLDFKPMVCLT